MPIVITIIKKDITLKLTEPPIEQPIALGFQKDKVYEW